MARETAEVAIVGAGIVGCAAAYYLSQVGVRAVLVERDGVAGHASGFAYGGLYPLSGAGIPGPMFPLARKSFDLHRELAAALPEETGIDVGFRFRPTVSLAFTEREATDLRTNLAWVNEQRGFRAEWLSDSELHTLDGRIADDAPGGVLYHGAAEVDAAEVTRALADASGARVRRAVAIGLARNGDRVAGVRLEGGETIACETVLLAQGPWAGAASDWLGLSVAVAPLQGEILRLAAPGPAIDCSIGWRGNYATTKRDGLLWAGTTEEEAGFREQPTTAGRRSVLANLLRMMPGLGDVTVVTQTACLRPMTPDGHVLLGRVGGLRGAWLATGGGRKGILHGPAMGAVCADLITTDETDLDLAPYEPERFAPA